MHVMLPSHSGQYVEGSSQTYAKWLIDLSSYLGTEELPKTFGQYWETISVAGFELSHPVQWTLQYKQERAWAVSILHRRYLVENREFRVFIQYEKENLGIPKPMSTELTDAASKKASSGFT